MSALSLAQLRALEAVAAEGALLAAVERLGRSHPELHAVLSRLEREAGFVLFDRTSPRLALTQSGAAFLSRLRRVLDGLVEAPEDHDLPRRQPALAPPDQSVLRVVIGELTSLSDVAGLLQDVLAGDAQTRVSLQVAALSAPWDSLIEGRCDVILHHGPRGDDRFETLALGPVRVLPVAAPGFVPASHGAALIARMPDLVQCVIEQPGAGPKASADFRQPGARVFSVSDQAMKRHVVLQGLAWGMLPEKLVVDDLREGRLVQLGQGVFRMASANLIAARLAGKPHSPAARRLWAALQQSRTPINLPIRLRA